MTAIHFERRFDALMKYVLLNGIQPLGKVRDYFARVEFQNRGSPHIHMFFWIENIPNNIDSESIVQLKKYINDTIVTGVPDQYLDPELYDLVKRLQTHNHSPYCSNNYKSKCRFNFPKKECNETKIFSNINLSKKNKGKFYVTLRKKDDVMINAFNPVVLRHWRANMDIQLICNAEGAAYYVCSYICKSEPDELKNALGNLIHNVFETNPSIPKHIKLLKIGLTVLRHRRMSSQEAAYRLSNLNLIHTSRRFVYLNTRQPSQRFKILKSKKEINDLPENSTDVFQTNVYDYYQHRTHSMENLSLYRFCSWYEKTNLGQPKRKCLERIYIAKYDIWMKKVKKPFVIRTPTYPSYSEDYFYSILVLLLPHRSDKEIMHPFSSAKESFINKYCLLNDSIDFTHFSFSEQIENTLRRINLEEELNNLSTNSENNQTSRYDQNEIFEAFSCMNDESDEQRSNDISFEDDLHMHSLACTMSLEEFHNSVKKLTLSQSKVLKFLKLKFQNKEFPFYMFISGGAGVGKTFLTKVIVAYLQLFCSKVSNSNPVLVCAPTGTAEQFIPC